MCDVLMLSSCLNYLDINLRYIVILCLFYFACTFACTQKYCPYSDKSLWYFPWLFLKCKVYVIKLSLFYFYPACFLKLNICNLSIEYAEFMGCNYKATLFLSPGISLTFFCGAGSFVSLW